MDQGRGRSAVGFQIQGFTADHGPDSGLASSQGLGQGNDIRDDSCLLEGKEIACLTHSAFSINILYAVTASGGRVDYYMGDKHPEINTTGKALQMYWDHMLDQPGEYIRQRLANLWELWGCPSAADGGRGMGSRIIMLTGNLFMVILGFVGWWKNRKIFNVSVPFLVVTPLHTLLIAIPRYTYPVEPFMLILSAWALMFWPLFPDPPYKRRESL